MYEDFDGLGHYRKTTSRGSLDPEDLQIATTGFDRTSTTYDYDPETGQYGPAHDFQMLGEAEPWILGVYSSTSNADETEATARSETCFDRTTGQPLRQRTLVDTSSTARSSRDLLTTFSYDGAGNLTDEKTYGGDGDGQALGTGSLCTLALPSAPAYRRVHGYQHGVKATSRVVDPADATDTVLRLEDLTIDWASGLVAASRDPSGLETTYNFDALGRPTRITPPADARFDFDYHPATASDRAWAHVRRVGANGAVLLEAKTFFDGLGRAVETQTRLPAPGGGHRWNRQLTELDGLGRVVRTSTAGPLAGAGSEPTWTRQDYDIRAAVVV